MKKTVVIIGAGPAGLCAAYKLTSDYPDLYKVILLEKASTVGGLSKTVSNGEISLDIGGHRFFTDNPDVSAIWDKLLPHEEFLSVSRSSKILYDQQFYTYPIALSMKTLKQLGLRRGLHILAGYLFSRNKYSEINNLEQFYIRQFGEPLYRLFFKDYTEKVWGKTASEISPDWGMQRTEGLSLGRILIEKRIHEMPSAPRTSVSMFRYPSKGAGEIWNRMAESIKEQGGMIICDEQVLKIDTNNRVFSVQCESGRQYQADYLISSMPLIDTAHAVTNIPPAIKAIAESLKYRDFIIVGLALKRAWLEGHRLMDRNNQLLRDQWIYIQDSSVKLGRIQLFENWSPCFSVDTDTVLLGLEYFCNKDSKEWDENDAFWEQTALSELVSLDVIGKEARSHRCIVYRAEKAYPCYWGEYEKLSTLTDYFDEFRNLFLIGRNGRHYYCNMDQAMASGLDAVKKITMR